MGQVIRGPWLSRVSSTGAGPPSNLRQLVESNLRRLSAHKAASADQEAVSGWAQPLVDNLNRNVLNDVLTN